MRKNKRIHLLEQDTSRWLVSYADFITLLFAFFVVMYAISSVNVSKYKSMAQGLQSVFNNQKTKNPMKDKVSRVSAPSGVSFRQPIPSLNQIDKDLEQMSHKDMTVSQYQGWIELDIKANTLFEVGQARINPKAINQITDIANLIKKTDHPVSLEGYTDNEPINTSAFPSNWELSAARAAAIARVLVLKGVNPNQVSATGFGAQHPIASNKSKSGRAKNRRVVIIIAKDGKVERLLNPQLSQRLAKKKKEKEFKVEEVKSKDGSVKFIRVKTKKEVK